MFDTKKEKYAYVQGLRAGARGKKPYAKGAPRNGGKSYSKRENKPSHPGSFDTDDFFQAALRRSYSYLDK